MASLWTTTANRHGYLQRTQIEKDTRLLQLKIKEKLIVKVITFFHSAIEIDYPAKIAFSLHPALRCLVVLLFES